MKAAAVVTDGTDRSAELRAVSARLAAASTRMEDLAHMTPPTAHGVAAGVAAICNSVLEAETIGMPRAEILARVTRAREIHARSPFIRRLQQWPRGYPGDFETIGYLLRGEVRAAPNTIGFHLEAMALGSPIARQHHHKVGAQAERIRRCLELKRDPGARVLMLACGGSPDLQRLPPDVLAKADRLVLNDADPAAVRHSLEIMHPRFGHGLEAVEGNVFRRLGRLRAAGPFDLVLAGGLFDYLSDRAAVMLLRAIGTRLLAKRGHVFFTNLAHGNPYRQWIEYMADWHLIERSRSEVESLVRRGLGTSARLTLTRDPTRLTWLADVCVRP